MATCPLFYFSAQHCIMGGLRKASALPVFHPLTGCDTTSAFAGRGKRPAWEIWSTLPEIASTFSALFNSKCILTLYYRTFEAMKLNKA